MKKQTNDIVIVSLTTKEKSMIIFRVILCISVLIRMAFVILNICNIFFNEAIVPQFVLVLIIDAIILISLVFSIKMKTSKLRILFLVIAAIVMAFLISFSLSINSENTITPLYSEDGDIELVVVTTDSFFGTNNKFYRTVSNVFMKDTGKQIDFKYERYNLLNDYKAEYYDDKCLFYYKIDGDSEYSLIKIAY